MATGAMIQPVQTVSGNQPRMRRIIEDALETFLLGTPVEIRDSNGSVEAWDGATIALGIAGFSAEPASNLATAGVPVTLTFGSVQNQASAVNIPRGAPLNDGRVGFYVANDDTIFRGRVSSAQSVTQADVGNSYGLTKGTDNYWYVDTAKTAGNACVRIVKLDPNDQGSSIRGVYFVVLPASQQFQG